MAYFAELDDNNIVIRVLAVPDDQENRGHQYLANDIGLGGRWLQTSFNTFGGQHRTGGTPLRMNYAGIGYTYDPDRDAFIPPSPGLGFTFNSETCLWDRDE